MHDRPRREEALDEWLAAMERHLEPLLARRPSEIDVYEEPVQVVTPAGLACAGDRSRRGSCRESCRIGCLTVPVPASWYVTLRGG
ncbi:hypothetical protein ACFQ8C_12440 [Streptomyces sp. NPDC056503]|uniref:hypothetical protein n=1 Tax=Streptomyces sp. NPDC056503 TaxID=3345842 RepID=UPI0036B692D6